jgi:hypothetical protein
MEDRGHGASCGHKNHDASFRIPDNMFFFDPVEFDDSCSWITKYPDNDLLWLESVESVCIGQSFGFFHKTRKHF